MPSPGQRRASDVQYTFRTAVPVPFATNHKYLDMVQPSLFLPFYTSVQRLLLVVLLLIVGQSYSSSLSHYPSQPFSMHVPPSTSPPLPASCFAGNPVSPLSVDGEPEGGATSLAQPGGLEIEASSPPQPAEPLPPRVVTPRRRRSPTPVELQGTRLRTHTTPTSRGGQSSVRIHQLRHNREASTQPLATSSNTTSHVPTTVVIPPSPDDQHGLASSNMAGHIPGGVVIPPPSIPGAAAPPPSDQQGLAYPPQYYPQYHGAPFLPPGYSHLPGAAMYPQQMHIPPQWGPQSIPYPLYSHPSESRATSPFLPPGPETQHRHNSAHRSGSTVNKLHSNPPESRATSPFPPPGSNRHGSAPPPGDMVNNSHSHPPESRATSPFFPGSNRHDSVPLPVGTPSQAASPLLPPTLPCASTAPAPAPLPAPPPPTGCVYPSSPAPAPAPVPSLPARSGSTASTGDSSTEDDIPGLPDLIPTTNLQKLRPEDGRNVSDPFIDLDSSPPLHQPKTGVSHENIDPFIDLASPRNDSSPPASADPSKPKFKVGRRSKEDQEDWDKFVQDCDLMYLNYAKKKNMPMEQVFAQYSTLRRRLNADSQWNFYQKLWAANLKQEMERAHKYISHLGSKGEVIEKVEEMSTQSLCSYGYAAYKQEYADDWKERLELYNDLKLASGESMDYRTRSKAWNKFIDKLKHLCGAAYQSYEFNVAWVAVGSAILTDQGLQESGETEGVKGAWEIKYRCPNGYEKIHLKAHSHQLLSLKLLKAEWGDDDALTNAEAGSSLTVTQGSPMKVTSAHAAPTLFGVDPQDFNKLTDINKLRKCWTYNTTLVDPTWNEGHQLLWKGRLAKYAFRGIRVRSYPRGCLVPGQTLLAVSKGIADTPGDQVKILLSAFGVPGHTPIENPITFEIVDNETKDSMLANQTPVLIEVPPPPGSTATRARQHYADGHVDDEGPSRTELAKRAVTFSIAAAPSHIISDQASSPAPPATIPSPGPIRGGKKLPPITRPKIYMQSHKAAAEAEDTNTIIISSSSSPEASPTPAPKAKSRKRPLSVDEEIDARPCHDNDSEQKGEAGNIFQRGLTPRRGRGAAFTGSSRSAQSEKPKGESKRAESKRAESKRAESKKPKAEATKSKYKSNEFIFDTPSPPPSPPHPTTSKPTTRPVPRRTPLNAPPSEFSKPPSIKLRTDRDSQPSHALPVSQALLEPPVHHPSLEPRQAPTGTSAGLEPLARTMPGPSAPHSIPPSQDQQQRPSSIPTDQAAHPPPNVVYYDTANHPHNPGYVGPHAATGFPMRFFNQPVAYHQPPQEGGGMPQHEGQLLPMGMSMGGRGGQHQGQMQVGGMPLQWPGGGMYYPSMAYTGSGYGYPPAMTQQQQPAQQDATHYPAGDYTLRAPEHEHY